MLSVLCSSHRKPFTSLFSFLFLFLLFLTSTKNTFISLFTWQFTFSSHLNLYCFLLGQLWQTYWHTNSRPVAVKQYPAQFQSSFGHSPTWVSHPQNCMDPWWPSQLWWRQLARLSKLTKMDILYQSLHKLMYGGTKLQKQCSNSRCSPLSYLCGQSNLSDIYNYF